MREIKFRAWDTRYKNGDKTKPINKMINWSELDVFCGYDGFDLDYIFNNDRLILMQFTGLKDKNGKEIYEGDIVSMYAEDFFDYGEPAPSEDLDDVAKVVFENGCYWLEMDKSKEKWQSFCITELKEMDVEVIGNIYENPELLKEIK